MYSLWLGHQISFKDPCPGPLVREYLTTRWLITSSIWFSFFVFQFLLGFLSVDSKDDGRLKACESICPSLGSPGVLTVACARIPLNACLPGNTWTSLEKEYKEPSLHPTGMTEGVTLL